MATDTLTKLNPEDLLSIYGGQKIYCATDPQNNKTRYFVPDETGLFMCYDRTIAIDNAPPFGNYQIIPCDTLQEAESYAWSVVNNFHLFSKK